MRVTLVRPPRLFSRSALTTNVPVPPLGLAYLSAALRRAGFSTRVIDACGEALDQCVSLEGLGVVMNGLTPEAIAERVAPDSLFVGISCMFSCEWLAHRRVIEAVRRRLPAVPIVVGGEHVTADPAAVLHACPAVTACAVGEGDETVVAVARALAAGLPLGDVAGLVLRAPDGTIVRTPSADPMEIALYLRIRRRPS